MKTSFELKVATILKLEKPKSELVVSWEKLSQHRTEDGWDKPNTQAEPSDNLLIDQLDLILEQLTPQISIMKYKALLRNLIHRGEDDSESDYDYKKVIGFKKIILSELETFLKDN